mmetsp:Transcript_29567/g.36683  ORF Transcript_29567/g.36683 Transcript_29567/m.36683 type:complete len:94 (-) Transcript_29567:733-1014(-)
MNFGICISIMSGSEVGPLLVPLLEQVIVVFLDCESVVVDFVPSFLHLIILLLKHFLYFLLLFAKLFVESIALRSVFFTKSIGLGVVVLHSALA